MRIHVKNFQSLADTAVDIDGLTVVVGASDLGKSALIRAISAGLFNRPGDTFVRLGASTTVVDLADVPGVHGPLQITWRKGKGTNAFDVNGESYTKVGTDAPPVVAAAGFCEIAVGTETLRPQVATQFDRLFLLDRPGSFISDVLTLLSRLSVLTTADRFCSKDLTSQRQALVIRTADLADAQARAAVAAQVQDLATRVQVLAVEHRALARECTKLRRLEQLAPLRRRQTVAAETVLPPVTPAALTLTAGDRLLVLIDRARARRHAQRVLASGVIPPQPVSVVEIARRHDYFRTVGQLAAERQGLQRRLQRPLPPARHVDFSRVDQGWALLQQLVPLALKRSTAVQARFESEAAARSARTEEEVAAADYSTLRAQVKICPVCERPL